MLPVPVKPQPLILPLPIEEYFRYHPPATEERKANHDCVNQFALDMAIALIQADFTLEAVAAWIRSARDLVDQICRDAICQKWALHAVDGIWSAALATDSEAIVMFIQQYRMFLNQGITIDELMLKQNEVTIDDSDSAEELERAGVES